MIQIPAVWTVPDDQRFEFANQFAVQVDNDGMFFLSMGQTAPPLLLGTPEEKFEQARHLAFVPIKSVGRFSITPANIERLMGILQELKDNYDKGLTSHKGQS